MERYIKGKENTIESGFVITDSEVQDIKEMLDAFTEIVEDIPDIRDRVVGDGKLTVKDKMAKVEAIRLTDCINDIQLDGGRDERLLYNLKILQKLESIARENPKFRFHQLLQGVYAELPGVDQFYEESKQTFERMFCEPGVPPRGKD